MTLQFVLVVLLAIVCLITGYGYGFVRGLKKGAHITAKMIQDGLLVYTEKGKAEKDKWLAKQRQNVSELPQ